MADDYYKKSVQSVLDRLGSGIEHGLNQEEVVKRQEKFGLNKLPEKKSFSKFSLFVSQFKSPIVYILLVASLVTFILGETTDAAVILIAVLINSAFGYWEEMKSLSVLDKLKRVLESRVTVLRNGNKMKIPDRDIVPGDILILESGDKIPADGRVIRSDNLEVSQASITGEWLAVKKQTGEINGDVPIADRDNTVLAGSLVENGEGMVVVTRTGADTQLGKIARLTIEATEEPSPLQKKLSKFGQTISLIILLSVGFIFAGGLLRKGNPLEMFETSVAIAIGGIPEALPVVMTVILAIGMDRLLKKRGLIRKLSSVETLGSTNIICLDKTKTLTQGKMAVDLMISADENELLECACLASEAFTENPGSDVSGWKINGSPSGSAVIRKAGERKIFKNILESRYPEKARLPFDPEKKFMVSLRENQGKLHVFVLGSPESILAISVNKDGWEEKAAGEADKGNRVIAAGYKELEMRDYNLDDLKNITGVEFKGLISLIDPLRPDINEAVKVCREAGMEPVIITGDNQRTALNIARQAGIDIREDEACLGKDLDGLDDEKLGELVSRMRLYARAEPRHKMQIVKAWQNKGKVVAMTGDGVNDAPAIKQADIGLALGSGTEVAIAAADLVLLDDSFRIIIDAIEQGRVVIDNLRKSISYILADAFSSVILIGVVKVIMGWPMPVLPVQILWNNFIEDTLPDIAYAFEPKEEGVMQRKPLPVITPLLNNEMKMLIFGTGLVDEFLMVVVFWYLYIRMGYDLSYVRTMIYGCMSLDTAFVVYAYKNLHKNLWNINIFSNKYLLLSSVMVFVSVSSAVYLPPLQHILHTVALDPGSWMILIAVGIGNLAIVEATKWVYIRFRLK